MIQIGEVLPILIGKGEVPQVWLQGPSDTTGQNFIQLVTASVSSHPAILVNSTSLGLAVSAGGREVLRVRPIGPNEAIVDFLDLRPLGFNIFGDDQMLNAGGMKMSRNTIAGGGTFLALGGA